MLNRQLSLVVNFKLCKFENNLKLKQLWKLQSTQAKL